MQVVPLVGRAQTLNFDFPSTAFETAAGLAGFSTKNIDSPSAEFQVADIPFDAAILSSAVATLSPVSELGYSGQ